MLQAFLLDASVTFSGCMRPTVTKLMQACPSVTEGLEQCLYRWKGPAEMGQMGTQTGESLAGSRPATQSSLPSAPTTPMGPFAGTASDHARLATSDTVTTQPVGPAARR